MRLQASLSGPTVFSVNLLLFLLLLCLRVFRSMWCTASCFLLVRYREIKASSLATAASPLWCSYAMHTCGPVVLSSVLTRESDGALHIPPGGDDGVCGRTAVLQPFSVLVSVASMVAQPLRVSSVTLCPVFGPVLS